MFKLVSSIIDTVFGRKRPLDVDDEDEIVEQQKKQKLDMTHRIKVTNLPVRELPAVKKYFKKLGYNRIKKAPEWDFGFITVDSEEEAQKCLEVVNNSTFKNRQLAGEYITETVQEHRDKFMNGNRGGKKGKRNQPMVDDKDDTRTPAEKLADQVTPLWREPYDVQLVKKNRNGTKQLMNLKRKIQSLKDVRDESQRAWAFEKGSLPCEVLDPIPSPEINGYRTKCEFTIGKNLDGVPTVGFLLGLYRDGITSVLEPSECLNVSDTAKHIARVFGDYVRNSDLPVYDRVEKTGCWRTIMTKTQSTGDVLILVQLRAADLTPERLEEEKKNLIQFWTQESGINVTTLIFQVWDGNSNGITDKAPMETLTGDGYIYENVLGCRFRLSASAFFQVNTPAAELLYAKCAEWCSIDASKKTTLLDLCCGTGTIGITMAKSVDRVVGIEMVPEAIVDAKANAKLNSKFVLFWRAGLRKLTLPIDIENVTYYANKVEDKIDVVTGEKNEEVIAVLDPPR